MKKILLTALCGAMANFAFADRVLFEENFESLQPWCDNNPAIIDNIALNDAITETPQVEGVKNAEGQWARNFLWDKGYWFMGLNANNSDDNIGWCGTKAVYMGKNFLRFGKTDTQARFKIKPDVLNINLDDDEYLVVEFDWTPWRDADGVYDDVSLDIEFFTDAEEFVEHNAVTVATHSLQPNTPMAWQHVEADLSDYDIQSSHFFVFTPSKEYYGIRYTDVQKGVAGNHRWAIDNIKFIARSFGSSGVGEVSVESDAPVEYFNLQGVRVENPETGLYIRRQGTKTTKILF